MKRIACCCFLAFCCALYADEEGTDTAHGKKTQEELESRSKFIIGILKTRRNFDFKNDPLSDFALYVQQCIKESIYVRMEASPKRLDPRFQVYLASDPRKVSLQLKGAEIGKALSKMCETHSLVAIVTDNTIVILGNNIYLSEKMYEWPYPHVAVLKK